MKELIINFLKKNIASLHEIIELENIDSFVERVIKNASIITFYEEGILAGFLAYYSNRPDTKIGFLTLLIVDESFRNRRIAGKLLKFSVEELEDKGFERFHLEVLKENRHAISLYNKNGFKMIQDRKNTWIMEKRINGK